MSPNDPRSEALAAASERRIELKEAVSNAERAASAPTAMPSWRDYMLSQFEALQTALDQHIEEVERPDGLLAELREQVPRLVNRVDKVRDEHPELRQSVEKTMAMLKGTTDSLEVRQAVLEVLFAIVRHRQHGADLVYEGYNVDIGGG